MYKHHSLEKLTRSLPRSAGFLAALAALSLSPACGDKNDEPDDEDGESGGSGSDDESSGGRKGTGGSGGTGGGGGLGGQGGDNLGGESHGSGGGANENALYAMVAHVPTSDGEWDDYLVTTPSLDAGSVVSAQDGIELSDSAQAFGFNKEPWVWLGFVGSPTIERWRLGADDQMEAEELVSFANFGHTSANGILWYGTMINHDLAVGPEWNVPGGELARWNPRTMETLGVLPLNLPGSYPGVQGNPRMRADGTLLVGYYCNSYDEEGNLDEACLGFAILNEDASRIIAQKEFKGCDGGYLGSQGSTAPDGSVYFGPGSVYEDGELVEGTSCTLRVAPEATEFDEDFGVQHVFEGAENVARDYGFSYFLGKRAVFPMITDSVTATAEGEEYEQNLHQWFTWDFEAKEPKILPGDNEPVFLATTSLMSVDNRYFFGAACLPGEDDCKGLRFYEVTEEGVIPAFKLEGAASMYSIVRVR